MMQQKVLFFILLLFFFSIFETSSQNWRFPDCRDLSITKIGFDSTMDTLSVTVLNSCDTCVQHVYTGLIAFNKHDTIAIDKNLWRAQSPKNNSENTYKLLIQQPFEIADIYRIKMVGGLCDSIPFQGDPLSLSHLEPIEKDFTIYPNPSSESIQFKHSANLKIHSIRISNLSGKTVKFIENNISQVSIRDLPDGVYFASLQTTHKLFVKMFMKR